MAQQALSTDQQSWIFNQFNGTTYQANSMDVQHEPLYDEITTAQAASLNNLSQFFTSPANKTLNQTNVTTAKKLDAPEAFAVMGIKFYPDPTALLLDITNIFKNFVLEFWIGQKYYNRGPLWFYNPGGGVGGFMTNGTTSFYTNGVPGRNAGHELAINIVIDNQASFFGQLVGVSTTMTATAAGGVGSILFMLLDGLHARGVQ